MTTKVTKDLLAAGAVEGAMGSQFSHRNKIINGDMNIAQRGASFAAIADGAYSLDRWKFQNSSAAVATVSQQADAPSDNEFQNSLRVNVTTADASIGAADRMTVRSYLEGYNVRDLIGRTFTISFRVRSSKTGVHCLALSNSGIDRSYVAEYTINVANTWETKSVTVSGGLITAGTWDWTNGQGLGIHFMLACGSTFHTTKDAWQTGNFFATSNQVNCLDTIGNIFAITGVQLEVGSVATPFEHRPYGVELALCQRYCYRIQPSTTFSPIGVGRWFAANSTQIYVPFPVEMRAAPSGPIVEGGVGQFALNTGGTLAAVAATAISIDQAHKTAMTLRADYATGGQTVGQSTTMYTNNQTTNSLRFESEL